MSLVRLASDSFQEGPQSHISSPRPKKIEADHDPQSSENEARQWYFKPAWDHSDSGNPARFHGRARIRQYPTCVRIRVPIALRHCNMEDSDANLDFDLCGGCGRHDCFGAGSRRRDRLAEKGREYD
jgi:hypothetical protein